ncbi:MAG: flavin reductase family protein [Polyangiales bacterium]
MIHEARFFRDQHLGFRSTGRVNVFASIKFEDSRLERVSWTQGEFGAPLIDGALANIECEVRAVYEEGSHAIYIGKVLAANVRNAEPLVYFSGSYRALLP